MSIIWPSHVKPNPDGIQRFGRVLHWTGTLIGVGLLIGGFVAETADHDSGGTVIGIFAVVAVIFIMAARACRYMLAGE